MKLPCKVEVLSDNIVIIDADNELVGYIDDPKNADLIVASLNACEGIDMEVLLNARTGVDNLKERIIALEEMLRELERAGNNDSMED